MSATTAAPDPSGRPMTALKQCRHGRMLYLPHDSYIGRSLDLYGEFSEREGAVFAQLVRPGQIVVEVGANIGAHTLHLAKLVGPSGLVVALEPQRQLFYLLCANLALNEQFQVRAYGVAAGSSVGRTKVPPIDYRRDGNFGGVSLSDAGSDAGGGEEVQVVTLDSFATLPSLRLLKIDVEGMEVEVLRGARQTIARHRPILYVENDRRQHSARLIGLLQTFDYELYWDMPPLFNPDNFAGHPDNVFPGIVSINLLCMPREIGMPVSGRRVAGPDDWWRQPG